MRVTIHGGIGEIGGNKILVEDGDTRVFLDFGMSFSRHQAFFDEYLKPRPVLADLLRLGVLPSIDGIYRDDLVRPDGWDDAAGHEEWPPGYWDAPVTTAREHMARHGKAAVDAVILTHAHADHVNHVAYLDPTIPVYASPVTLTLVRAISELSRSGLENEFYATRRRSFAQNAKGYFPKSWTTGRDGNPVTRPFTPVPELTPFRIGSLEITLVPVDHSVPGACGIHVRSAAGKTLFYTGDVRFHGNLHARQRALRDFATNLAPDLLVCEGTRLGPEDGDRRDGEADVEAEVKRVVQSTRGASFVEFGWKDTTRFDTLQRVAAATGRTLVVSPKLAYLLHALKRDHGNGHATVDDHAHVRTYLDRRRSLLYSKSDYTTEKYPLGYELEWPRNSSESDWPAEERARRLAHYDGGVRAPEVRAHPEKFIVTLSFFEMNDLFDFDPPQGSTYLRCQCEPFNDEMRLDQEKQENWLAAFGLNAGAGGALLKAHASGHAGRSDLMEFARGVGASRVLPVHTEHWDAFEGVAPEVVPWGPRTRDPVIVDL